MILPLFVYLKKKKTASTSTATPAEPKADSIPMRMPLPVDPPSLLILITIEDVAVSWFIGDCRDAEPNEFVAVGSCIKEDESRVEVVKVEYIRSPTAAPLSPLISHYARVVCDDLDKAKGEGDVAHCRYVTQAWGRRHGAAGMSKEAALSDDSSKDCSAPVSMK